DFTSAKTLFSSSPISNMCSDREVRAKLKTRSFWASRSDSIFEHVHWGTIPMNSQATGIKTALAGTNFQSPPGLVCHGRQIARHLYVMLISSVAAIGGFLFGFDSGVINGTVNALSVAFGTEAAGTGFAVASVLLGCALGAFGAGTLANRIG